MQCGRCAWNQRGLARSWETWRIGSPWTPLSAWSSKLGIGLIPRNSPTGTPSSSQLPSVPVPATCCPRISSPTAVTTRSEEHTSELQSLRHLVCRLLLENERQDPPAQACTSPCRRSPPPTSRLSTL